MSAVLAALANPAVDALAAQLIGQGLDYFNEMQRRRADGSLTEADVLAMAKKLDIDFDALVEARAQQRIREQALRDPKPADTSSTGGQGT